MDRPRNRLLAALPPDAFDRVNSRLERVPLRAGQILHHQGSRIEQVYFPNGGVVSITTVLSGGTTIEGATIGVEGVVGILGLFAAAPISPFESLVQVPDTDAMMLRTDAFREELTQAGALRHLLELYVQVVIAQMMQSNACNAVHPIKQRCARWLLTVQDHVSADEFPLSHEFLAQMLAVQRPSISDAAGTLRRAGLITYRHGRIRILDRPGLEGASCECYAVIRAHFDRLKQHLD